MATAATALTAAATAAAATAATARDNAGRKLMPLYCQRSTGRASCKQLPMKFFRMPVCSPLLVQAKNWYWIYVLV